MLDIQTLDLTMVDIANKLLSGALTPETRNRFYNLVNLDLLKLKAGLPEDFDAKNQQGFQVTFKNSDDIAFLIKEVDITRASNGFFPRPSDYAAFDYVLYGYITNACGKTSIAWKNIEPVTGSERAIRLDSALIPPDLEFPIIRWNALGWGVDPDAVKQLRLSYLRMPAKPIRNYTMVGDQDVFNPVGSVNAEWPETMFGDFVIRVCKYAGINLREQDFESMVLQRQISGQ